MRKDKEKRTYLDYCALWNIVQLTIAWATNKFELRLENPLDTGAPMHNIGNAL